MNRCTRCLLPFDTKKSSANLRLTYCTLTCEVADIGAPITAVERPLSSRPHRSLTDTPDVG